jgi:putative flippase GtrA
MAVDPEGAPRRSHAQKLFRYSAISVLFTALTFAGLAILVGLFDFPAGWANFLIVVTSIPFGFELNRRWVWSVGRDRFWQAPELIPFGAFSLLALGLSTLAVHRTGLAVAHWSRPGRAAAVEGASFASFGALWVIQYLVLDRILFRAGSTA